MIIIREGEAYKKRYKIRQSHPTSPEITVPLEVVEREARKKGMSIHDFMKLHLAEWNFNNFEGLYLRFVEKGRGEI